MFDFLTHIFVCMYAACLSLGGFEKKSKHYLEFFGKSNHEYLWPLPNTVTPLLLKLEFTCFPSVVFALEYM